MYNIADYQEALTLDTALKLLGQGYRPIAGGTDILVKVRGNKEGYAGAKYVGITRIDELKGIRQNSQGQILVGGINTFRELEKDPLVGQYLPVLQGGAALVGGPQTRAAGTIGGNLCNGAVSADTAPAAFVYQAQLVLLSPRGERRVNIEDFYQGPGRVDLRGDELLSHIVFDPAHFVGYRGHYIKAAQRQALDIANISCGVNIKVVDRRIEDIKIAFGVAAPTPVRGRSGETYARGKAFSEEVLEEMGRLCLGDTRPRDSWRASKLYRETLIRELPRRGALLAMGERIDD